MMFLVAEQGTMFLMLTQQDVNDMRGGRTKFVDKATTKGNRFDQVVLSLHKDQAEVEETLRRAGHGKLLQGMPSPVPAPPDGRCGGCQGIMPEPSLLDGQCIACWRETARRVEQPFA